MSFFDSLGQAAARFCGVAGSYDPDAAGSKTVLDWMENSAVGICVAASPTGYYIALAFHAIGLSMLVGVSWVIALSLLGKIKNTSLTGLYRLSRLAWWGLAINAVSGVLLFFSEANKAYYSISFRIKLSLVLLGCLILGWISKTILRPATQRHLDLLPASARLQAWSTIVVWVFVIFVGRFMSYLTNIQ